MKVYILKLIPSLEDTVLDSLPGKIELVTTKLGKVGDKLSHLIFAFKFALGHCFGVLSKLVTKNTFRDSTIPALYYL